MKFQAYQKDSHGRWQPVWSRPLESGVAHDLAAALARKTRRPVELRDQHGELECTWELGRHNTSTVDPG